MERGAKTNEIICGDAITAEALAAIPKPNRIIGPVRWYGGKGMLARWIVQQIPKGRLYCEPYCGAASVFWHLRPPREVEVLNDLHAEIITLFRVLQDREQFGELCHRLAWTPYSLDEFRRALAMEAVDGLSDVDRAWERPGRGMARHPGPILSAERRRVPLARNRDQCRVYQAGNGADPQGRAAAGGGWMVSRERQRG